MVGAWVIVEAIGPGTRYYFDKVFITLVILCQQYKMTTIVALVCLVFFAVVGYVGFTAKDWLETLAFDILFLCLKRSYQF